MNYHPDIHHRRSVRLKEHDYSQAGVYFVTVCTKDRECILGTVKNGEMCPNYAGQMVQSIWNELPIYYPGVNVDAFIVMPNHIHGIIELIPVGAAPRGRPKKITKSLPRNKNTGQRIVFNGVAPTISLPDVIHRFKSLTTTRYREGVQQHNWQPFPGKLWQRNYYEHIVRDEYEMDRIREYITRNPAQWLEDEENPENISS